MADSQKPLPKRPLPKTHELDTQAFWAATKNEELTYQRCDDCDTIIFYPRRHCTSCLGNSLTVHTASGRGTIYTYSVVRQSYHPFFHPRVPYAVAWIDLDEGPRLLSEIVDVEDPGSLEIGQRVKVSWESHEELSVPLFTPE
ncbi:MAG: OB-fold domain-containing protein [Gammaproteobacteria bacterium]|nr:OB-fold domain-containing protein [Gammaproteobacteria bacterium]